MGVPFQLLGELLPNFWIFEKKSISFSEKRKKSWNTTPQVIKEEEAEVRKIRAL